MHYFEKNVVPPDPTGVLPLDPAGDNSVLQTPLLPTSGNNPAGAQNNHYFE